MEEKKSNSERIEEEIDLIELWNTIWSQRKFIAIFVGSIVFLTTVVSFILPKTYTSKAVLVPVSKDSQSSMSVLAQIAGLPASPNSSQANIKAVLESLTLRKKIVNELNLVDELLRDSKNNFRYPDVVAAESIKGNIKTSINQKDGTIAVEVEWKDPDMAQKINQSIIKNLREILNQKAFSIAKMNRIFYEQEMNKVSNELKESLEKLNRYQQEKKVILPENTLQNQIQMYASLLSEKLKIEAELNSYSNIYTPDHPKIRELKTRLAYLSQKLAEIEGDIKTNSPLSAERTLSAIPDYMTLYIKVQQLKAKYEMLVKLLEQARIDELKENLYVEVIDEPTYPEKPSKPKKKFLVAAAFVSSLMLAVFIALVRGAIRKKKGLEGV